MCTEIELWLQLHISSWSILRLIVKLIRNIWKNIYFGCWSMGFGGHYKSETIYVSVIDFLSTHSVFKCCMVHGFGLENNSSSSVLSHFNIYYLYLLFTFFTFRTLQNIIPTFNRSSGVLDDIYECFHFSVFKVANYTLSYLHHCMSDWMEVVDWSEQVSIRIWIELSVNSSLGNKLLNVYSWPCLKSIISASCHANCLHWLMHFI